VGIEMGRSDDTLNALLLHDIYHFQRGLCVHSTVVKSGQNMAMVICKHIQLSSFFFFELHFPVFKNKTSIGAALHIFFSAAVIIFR
jgi:hypothetical protein